MTDKNLRLPLCSATSLVGILSRQIEKIKQALCTEPEAQAELEEDANKFIADTLRQLKKIQALYKSGAVRGFCREETGYALNRLRGATRAAGMELESLPWASDCTDFNRLKAIVDNWDIEDCRADEDWFCPASEKLTAAQRGKLKESIRKVDKVLLPRNCPYNTNPEGDYAICVDACWNGVKTRVMTDISYRPGNFNSKFKPFF